jgi:hypothetical protein
MSRRVTQYGSWRKDIVFAVRPEYMMGPCRKTVILCLLPPIGYGTQNFGSARNKIFQRLFNLLMGQRYD